MSMSMRIWYQSSAQISSLTNYKASLQKLAAKTSDTLVRDRATQLSQRGQAFPLSAKAKMRAAVGDRVRWYQEPEEV